MESPMTAADVGAVLGNRSNGLGDGMGGGFWIFALIVLAFMGNGNGFFGNRGGAMPDVVTNADLANANNFTQLENAVGRLGDSQTAIAMQEQRDLCTGLSALEQSINENRFASQQCCCEIKETISSEFRNFEQRDAARREAEKDARIAALEQKILVDQATQGVIRYPQGFCYSAANPFFGNNNGCCNSNNVLF